MTKKDVRLIVAEYVQAGFRVEQPKNHVKIYDGRRLVTTLSYSHCGGRASQNARAALRRALRERAAA